MVNISIWSCRSFLPGAEIFSLALLLFMLCAIEVWPNPVPNWISRVQKCISIYILVIDACNWWSWTLWFQDWFQVILSFHFIVSILSIFQMFRGSERKFCISLCCSPSAFVGRDCGFESHWRFLYWKVSLVIVWLTILHSSSMHKVMFLHTVCVVQCSGMLHIGVSGSNCVVDELSIFSNAAILCKLQVRTAIACVTAWVAMVDNCILVYHITRVEYGEEWRQMWG